MSVIHILGIQGSGKSYIGELIKKKLGNRVAICEVDDFYRDVYNEYSRLDKLVNAPQLTKRAEKNITDFVTTGTKNGKIVIVICVSYPDKISNCYFIKINNLEETR